MAVPKKRKSKQKSAQSIAGKRKIKAISVSACPNCGGPVIPHRVCMLCGHYNGKFHQAIITMAKTKQARKDRKSQENSTDPE